LCRWRVPEEGSWGHARRGREREGEGEKREKRCALTSSSTCARRCIRGLCKFEQWYCESHAPAAAGPRHPRRLIPRGNMDPPAACFARCGENGKDRWRGKGGRDKKERVAPTRFRAVLGGVRGTARGRDRMMAITMVRLVSLLPSTCIVHKRHEPQSRRAKRKLPEAMGIPRNTFNTHGLRILRVVRGLLRGGPVVGQHLSAARLAPPSRLLPARAGSSSRRLRA